MTAADLPIRSFAALWHVGTLSPADKHTWSYEGQGLSVSLHPEDWAFIARLGGNPTWRLTRPGNAFLDYHDLTADQRAEITAWGMSCGYVEQATVYRVTLTDEDGEESWLTCATRAEAEDEADVRAFDSDPADLITETTALVATDTFPDPTVAAGDIDLDQVLAVVWAATVHLHLDGVWWEDTYAPERLSAPRGVVHAHRVADWTVVRNPGGMAAGEQA
jgi:hypothetical protein